MNARADTDLDSPGPINESHSDQATRSVVPARLLLGLIVLICAEVFSGASVGPGLWSPWTWVVTYWLYFAHFFFFSTLAVYTRRTSLPSLYLWGVLYGLYEGPITKVIWYGYTADGNFAIGNIGPFGLSEISMVFFFHPLISFILPLAVACVLYPSLRQRFPDLAWLTGKSKFARFTQACLVLSFVPVMVMNSGGTVNLAANYLFILTLLYVLSRWARSMVSASNEQAIAVFGRRGFVGLCLYLALLYGVTYPLLTPDGIPSVAVRFLTLGIYALAMAGLWLHPSREPTTSDEAHVDDSERRLVKRLFVVMLASALVCSPLAGTMFIFVPVMVNFFLWSLLGFVLMAVALWYGVWARRQTPDDPSGGRSRPC